MGSPWRIDPTTHCTSLGQMHVKYNYWFLIGSGCRIEVDCHGDCGGSAKFNMKCGVCYGGKTGKTMDDVVGCDG